jgi:biotin synthase
MTFEEIRDALEQKGAAFHLTYHHKAKVARQRYFGNRIAVAGLLAISNYCRNSCDYCGLRAPNDKIPRYRLSLDEIKKSINGIRDHGIRKLFLISGEDPGIVMDDVLKAIEFAAGQGLSIMLGLGVYHRSVYTSMRNAGAELYALKFETSNEEIFSSVKPDITMDERMDAIRDVKESGLKLGSGNIVGLPGETVDDIARDILLMKELDIDWAPVVPYMPAPNTPLGVRQPMGSVDLLLREIALLRYLIPDTLITAGQPTQDSKLGFADPEGSKEAIRVGANLLFVDLTPDIRKESFAITQNRFLPRLEEIDKLLIEIGLERE